MVFSEIFFAIGAFAIWLITSLGYFGVFFLMVLESMVLPVPSELVMPFAGFAASEGRLDFFLIVISSSLGSLVGSLISYYIGLKGGNLFVKKFGKYFCLDEEIMKKTEAQFQKRGDKLIFIARFIPAVRHVVSLIAGTAKMNLKKFIIYTLIGATMWNIILLYVGFVLGKNWNLVREYTEPLSILVVLIVIGCIIYFAYKHFSRGKIKNEKGEIHKIQQPKMKELWDNKEDEAWEDA